MQRRQTKPLALILVFAIAGIAIAARNQPKAKQFTPKAPGKTDLTLEGLKPYRTWTKMNKQPIAIKLDQTAFAG